MALDQEDKKLIIENYSTNENDTGSTTIQIALLTARIKYLTEHLKENKKDHSSTRGLIKIVGKRRRLLRYLKKTNLTKWSNIKKDLKIRN